VLGCNLKQAMETTRIVLLEMGFKFVDENKEVFSKKLDKS